MIRSFGDKATEQLFNRDHVTKFAAFERIALRKLVQIDAATRIDDLVSPGNNLEKLKGDRQGQYSIRINDRYRICFAWQSGEAHDVEIVDYH